MKHNSDREEQQERREQPGADSQEDTRGQRSDKTDQREGTRLAERDACVQRLSRLAGLRLGLAALACPPDRGLRCRLRQLLGLRRRHGRDYRA